MQQLLVWFIETDSVVDPVVKTLFNYGILGVAVVVLGWLAWRKDSETKQLYAERIAAEQRFAAQHADMIYKYRDLMEKLNQTLDVLSRLVGKNGGFP